LPGDPCKAVSYNPSGITEHFSMTTSVFPESVVHVDVFPKGHVKKSIFIF
jgi:hypothetical protein